MLAARWRGRNDIEVEEVPDPGDPPPGWLRLRVAACGICGTDIEEYTSGPVVIPTETHPLSGRCAPLTLGHEAVGIVEAGGPGTTADVGMTVAVEGNLFCGTCWWCRRSEYQLCEQLAALGLMADGGLAQYMLAPERMCLPVSPDVPADHAALAEPLSVAVRAMTRGGIGVGTNLAVLGAGAIGLLIIQAARLAGANTIVAIDGIEARRSLALSLGADAAVSPDEAETAALELTEGIGVDVVLEAAGNAAAAAAAVRLARRGGRAVLLGVFDDDVSVGMMDLLMGEKTIVACLSHVYNRDFHHAVNMINRKALDLESLISGRIPLGDVVEQGFKALVAEPHAHLKVIVQP